MTGNEALEIESCRKRLAPKWQALPRKEAQVRLGEISLVTHYKPPLSIAPVRALKLAR